MNTSSGDYSFYQLALVSGLQKDYTGKITLLNRLVGKYPASPYAVNAIYEKGRSYVLWTTTIKPLPLSKNCLLNILKARSAGKLPPKSDYYITKKEITTKQLKPTNRLSKNIRAVKKPALPCVI